MQQPDLWVHGFVFWQSFSTTFTVKAEIVHSARSGRRVRRPFCIAFSGQWQARLLLHFTTIRHRSFWPAKSPVTAQQEYGVDPSAIEDLCIPICAWHAYGIIMEKSETKRRIAVGDVLRSFTFCITTNRMPLCRSPADWKRSRSLNCYPRTIQHTAITDTQRHQYGRSATADTRRRRFGSAVRCVQAWLSTARQRWTFPFS